MAKSELYGDWGKLKGILNNLRNLEGEYDDIIIEMGNEIANRIRGLVESQSIYLEPLQEEYRERKVAEGYDKRTLIRTGEFLESIRVIDIRTDGDEVDVFIGIEDGTTETGISMRELAMYIEYGTENQPARLPITRSWESMKAEVISETMNKLRDKIEGALR